MRDDKNLWEMMIDAPQKTIGVLLALFLLTIIGGVWLNRSQAKKHEQALAEKAAAMGELQGDFDRLYNLSTRFFTNIKDKVAEIDDDAIQAKATSIDTLLNHLLKGKDLSNDQFDEYSNLLIADYLNMIDLVRRIKDSRLRAEIEKNLAKQSKLIEALKRENTEFNEKLTAAQQALAKEKSTNVKIMGELAVLIEDLDNQHGISDSLRATIEEKDAALLTLLAEQEDLKETARKIKMLPYFLFKADNDRKETAVQLSKEGLASRYYNYFFRKNPEVEVYFTLNPEFFNEKEGIEVVLILENTTKNQDVFTETFTISKNEPQRVRIPHTAANFEKGDTYTLLLKKDKEHLIEGGKYMFDLIKK